MKPRSVVSLAVSFMGVVVAVSVVCATDLQNGSGRISLSPGDPTAQAVTPGQPMRPGNPADVKVYGPDDPDVQRALQRFRQAQTQSVQVDYGEEIVFVYNNDLWVQKADGTGRRALLLKGTDYAALGSPAWSLDGKSLAFAAIAKNDPRVVDLFTANADGSNPFIVTRLNAGYYSSTITSVSWFYDHQWLMFVYGYNAIDLTTLFLVCTIKRTGTDFGTAPQPDVMGSQYEPVNASTRYTYTTMGTPFNFKSNLVVSNLNGTNAVTWFQIANVDAMGDVVWIASTSIGAIVRYDPGYPNKELLVRFDRSGSTTTNAILIWSDVSARLSSPTFGPTRRKLYMTETKSNVATLWYSEWDQAWNSITNVARGYGGSPNWRQTLPLPAQVVLLSPSNNATSVATSPTLGWQAADGALWYKLRVFTQAGSLVVNDPNVAGTFKTIGPLTNTAQYIWTVSGVNNIGEGPISTSFKFTTGGATPNIAVTAPGAGVSWRVGTLQTVTWTSTNLVGNVTILLSTDGGSTFGWGLASNTANDGTETVTVPNYNSTTCRVRVESSASSTVFALNPGNFTVSPSSNDVSPQAAGIPMAYALEQNHPNPFNPTTVVRYQLPAVSQVQLVVFDMLGREVATLVNEEKNVGVHEVRFDAAGLASGVYLYRLQARPRGDGHVEMFVETKKLCVLR